MSLIVLRKKELISDADTTIWTCIWARFELVKNWVKWLREWNCWWVVGGKWLGMIFWEDEIKWVDEIVLLWDYMMEYRV